MSRNCAQHLHANTPLEPKGADDSLKDINKETEIKTKVQFQLVVVDCQFLQKPNTCEK